MQKLFTTISLSISLFTGVASAQTFQTGQAARAVIGQPTFTAQISGGVNSQAPCPPGQTANCIPTSSVSPLPGIQTPASDFVFGAMGGLAYAGGTLFVADSNRLGILPNNNRVLLFNNIGQVFPGASDEIAPGIARCPLCGGQANVILGQPDVSTVAAPNPPTSASMRLPLGVASDGQHVAVADTANNRILLWNSMPTNTGQPADLVLGQPNFTSFLSASPSASSLRGPQGVWFQNGMFFVADTGNNRILIWTSIPTANNQPANLVLGQPNFTSGGQYNLVQSDLASSASIMASPTSVTSDGTHLFVADLGFSRVLIWNSIPTRNQQAADIEVGQLDMAHSIANDSSELCAAIPGQTDTNGNPVYPFACRTTLNFPRFALADDKGRLYIADGGNDRVMVYNSIPTANMAAADAILGQPDEFSDVISSNQSILATGFPIVTSAADVTPTPTSLAWDGTNLYVADPTDFRILVYTPGQPNVTPTGIVNSASQAIFAQGSVLIGGDIQANDTVTVSIGANSTATAVDYTYKVLSTDTLDSVAQGVVDQINAANGGTGDPNVLVYERPGEQTIVIVARLSGPSGNNITLATTTAPTSSVKIMSATSGATLAGGGAAGQAAPGTLISINATDGATLADTTASAPGGLAAASLPFSLGGVEVYSDGNRMPLLMVSPTQINAQIPWEVTGSNSTSVYVRTQHNNGTVTVTNAIAVPLLDSGAPGIFAVTGTGTNEPRVGQVFHASSFASGVITINDAPVSTTTNGVTTSAIQAGDTGTITIGDRPYTYTTLATDTVGTIAAAFVGLINADSEATVTAKASAVGFAISVTAKVPGPMGNGISLGTNVTTLSTNISGALLTLSASGPLCCANIANRPVSVVNPATPGETIFFIGTGLGLVCTAANVDSNNNCLAGDPAKAALITGSAYTGPADNAPLSPINATVAGGSATVISAGVVPGANGIYQIVIQLPTTLTANPFTQLFIEQRFNTSNIVTLPVGNPLNF